MEQKLAKLKKLREAQERKVSEGAGRGAGETQEEHMEGHTTPPTNRAAATPPAAPPSPPPEHPSEPANEPASELANANGSKVNLTSTSRGLDGKKADHDTPQTPVYPDDYTLHSSEDAQVWTLRKDGARTFRYEESIDGRPQPVPHDYVSVHESPPASHSDSIGDTLFDTSIDDFETSSCIIGYMLSYLCAIAVVCTCVHF